LTCIVLFTTIVANWVWQQTETTALAKEAVELKEEGCKPAQKTKADMVLVKWRLNEIQKAQGEMQTVQGTIQATQTAIQADTKEILRRLPK